MTDQPAFIRTIMAAEDPGDACLVFSDWLDEQGRGREAWCLRRRVKMYHKITNELKKNKYIYHVSRTPKWSRWYSPKEESRLIKDYIMRKFVRKPSKFQRLTMA